MKSYSEQLEENKKIDAQIEALQAKKGSFQWGLRNVTITKVGNLDNFQIQTTDHPVEDDFIIVDGEDMGNIQATLNVMFPELVAVGDDYMEKKDLWKCMRDLAPEVNKGQISDWMKTNLKK